MDIRHLEAEILTLRHKLHQVTIVNREQATKIEQLTLDNKKFIQENQSLQNQLIKLQDKLNINSTNSGLPSSKDIYRIERKSKPSSGKKPVG